MSRSASKNSNGLRVTLALVGIVSVLAMALLWRALDGVTEVRAEVSDVRKEAAVHETEIGHLKETTKELQQDMRYVRRATNRVLDRFGIERPAEEE